jgi:hypothetical protein
LVSFGDCIVWNSDYFSDNTIAKRYQRSNQNARPYNGQKISKKLSECQTIQWPKDTKEVIRMPDNTMTKRYQRSN